MTNCPYRDICVVECRTGPRTVAELAFPCGFEQAGTVKGCPKARRFDDGVGRLRGESSGGEK